MSTLNTRLQLRIDSFENWQKWYLTSAQDTPCAAPSDYDKSDFDFTPYVNKGAALVLNRGEVAFCEIPTSSTEATTAPTILFKVGDGETPFCNLKWASARAADVHSWAKLSADDFKTWLNESYYNIAEIDEKLDGYDELCDYHDFEAVTELANKYNPIAYGGEDEPLSGHLSADLYHILKNFWNNVVLGSSTNAKATDETIYGAKAYADKLASDIKGSAPAGTTLHSLDEAIKQVAKDLDEVEVADFGKQIGDLRDELVGTTDVTNPSDLTSFTDDTGDTIKGAKQYASNLMTAMLSAYIKDDEDNTAINKLQEIVNWINADETGAADLVAQVVNKLNTEEFNTFKNGAFAQLKGTVDGLNTTELAQVNTGDVAKWNAAEGNAKSHADDLAAAIRGDAGDSVTLSSLGEDIESAIESANEYTNNQIGELGETYIAYNATDLIINCGTSTEVI